MINTNAMMTEMWDYILFVFVFVCTDLYAILKPATGVAGVQDLALRTRRIGIALLPEPELLPAQGAFLSLKMHMTTKDLLLKCVASFTCTETLVTKTKDFNT